MFRWITLYFNLFPFPLVDFIMWTALKLGTTEKNLAPSSLYLVISYLYTLVVFP